MANKVVLLMKSREDFSWGRLKALLSTHELVNRQGSSILLKAPILRKSVIYGVILHETDRRILRSDRIFSYRHNTPHAMSNREFWEVYQSVKKASSV